MNLVQNDSHDYAFCILKNARILIKIPITAKALADENLSAPFKFFHTVWRQRKEWMTMRKKVLTAVLAGMMALLMFTGCGGGGTEEEDNVLRVGMECAYAPFNWTQDSDTTPDGSEAVKIYDSEYYAYGYDVAVAQMLAEELGMELEIHKVGVVLDRHFDGRRRL